MVDVRTLVVVCGVLYVGIIGSVTTCRFGEGCTFPCHCGPDSECDDVTGDCGENGQCDDGNLGSSSTEYTAPWRGPGCQIGNVALYKSATQGPDSATTDTMANRSVDGNHDQINSCSRTKATSSEHAWWEVDLGRNYVISNITITARAISAATSLLNTDTFTWTNGLEHNKTTCDNIGDVSPGVTSLTLRCISEPIAQFVRLQHRELGASLQMCEVMVIGYLYHDCDCGIIAPGCLQCNYTTPTEIVDPGGDSNFVTIVATVVAAVVVALILILVICGIRRKKRGGCPADSQIPLRPAANDARNGEPHVANGGIAIDDEISPYQEVDLAPRFTNPKVSEVRGGAHSGSPRPQPRAREPEPDLLRDFKPTEKEKSKKPPLPTPESRDEAPEYGNESIKGRPIRVEEFPNIMRKIRHDRTFMAQEYKLMPSGVLNKATIGGLEFNRKKNRFKNIIPYDHSRVILTCDNNNNNDYINANYIKTPWSEDTPYIATQGPMSTTVPDFWRMVWQTGANRIVMLTKLRESGKAQCSPYWPTGGSMDSGDFKISLTNMTCLANHTLRTLSLKPKLEVRSRSVRQFHFTGWPDRGVPLMATSLLEFRRLVRSDDKLAKGPLIVHCSAGIGRTGAFIAIDQCLDQVEKHGEVDIFRVTETMRTCRADMIQLQERYQFVYEAIHEAILSEGTTIPCNEMEESYAQLMERGGGIDHIRLHKQYEALNSIRLGKDKQEKPDLSAKEKAKNRSRSIIASDRVRPKLTTVVQTDDCTSYINAVFVEGYRDQHAYIATQLPLPRTMADFWRLVWDHEPRSIVLLHLLDTDDQSMPVYWPEHTAEDLPIPPLFIGVRNTTDVRHSPMCYRDFEITNSNEGGNSSRTVRQFHMFSCKSRDEVPGSVDDVLQLLELLEHWQQQTGNKPAIVQCIDGNQLSGVFCAASYMLDKLKTEQEVDIFLAVRQVRLSRPQFIISQIQYKFLYDLALAYMRKHGAYSNFS